MSGYYRDPTRQNQYNRYTYAREGRLQPGEAQPRQPQFTAKQITAPSYQPQAPMPIEGEQIGKKTAQRFKNLAQEAIKIEALQYGITGTGFAQGFRRAGAQASPVNGTQASPVNGTQASKATGRPEVSGDEMPVGSTDLEAATANLFRNPTANVSPQFKSAAQQGSKRIKDDGKPKAGGNVKGLLDDLPY